MRVYSVDGNTVYFTTDKERYYGDKSLSDDNVGSSQYVALQRVPNYSTVTINWNGELTSSDWNGSYGGVLAFRAIDVYVGLLDGKYDAVTRTAYIRAKGFTGGGGTNYSGYAQSGDSYYLTSGGYSSGGAAYSSSATNGQPTPNPGGGGGGDTSYNSTVYNGSPGAWGSSGGGGGGGCSIGSGGSGWSGGFPGSGDYGGSGGSSSSNGSGSNAFGGGGGGYSNTSSNFASKVFLGSGGGAGGGSYSASGTSRNGANGGRGGGFIFIGANNIFVRQQSYSGYYDNGYITVNGSDADIPSFSGNSYPGGGGGGGGGSMMIKVNWIQIDHIYGVTASFGRGSIGGSGKQGGNGGNGGIYCLYSSKSGSSYPGVSTPPSE